MLFYNYHDFFEIQPRTSLFYTLSISAFSTMFIAMLGSSRAFCFGSSAAACFHTNPKRISLNAVFTHTKNSLKRSRRLIYLVKTIHMQTFRFSLSTKMENTQSNLFCSRVQPKNSIRHFMEGKTSVASTKRIGIQFYL